MSTPRLEGVLHTVEKVKFITCGFEYPLMRTFLACCYPSQPVQFYELHEDGEKVSAVHLLEVTKLINFADLDTFAWVDLLAVKCPVPATRESRNWLLLVRTSIRIGGWCMFVLQKGRWQDFFT